jgi:hypothetical protein
MRITGDSHGVRTESACVDAERLAEYVDGSLRAADRREIELHLLHCDACRQVVIEVAMSAAATGAVNPLEAPRGVVRVPWRRVAVVAASLAAAVVVTVGVHVWLSDSTHLSNGVVPVREGTGVGAGASPQQRALVEEELKEKVARKAEQERFFREQQQTASVSTAGPNRMLPIRDSPAWKRLLAVIETQSTRIIEGRLADFAYAPPPPPADDPREVRRVYAEAVVAADTAKLEAVQLPNDADSRAAAGVASLFADQRETAVHDLEQAVRLQPTNPFFLNDLSVALLALAHRTNRPDDFSRARTAAERAMRIAPDLNEPYFNRALAMEGLRLESQTAEAWRVVAARERGSSWGKEAESHLMARPR